jgi:hypothetical protein
MQTLVTLDLGGDEIGDEEVQNLAKALQNNSVKIFLHIFFSFAT